MGSASPVVEGAGRLCYSSATSLSKKC